jgi:hypothetical protein
MPNFAKILEFTCVGVFLLNIAAVLPLFIISPEAFSYRDRICCRCIAPETDALMKISESSAKKRWLMNGALEQILTPSIRPLLAASSISAEKASST